MKARELEIKLAQEKEIQMKQLEQEKELKLRQLEKEAELKEREMQKDAELKAKEMELQEQESDFKRQELLAKMEHEKNMEQLRQRGESERQKRELQHRQTEVLRQNGVTEANQMNTMTGLRERLDIPPLRSQNPTDIDNFLEKFTRLASMMEIPKAEWGRILTSKLDAQFNGLVNSIPIEKMRNFDEIVRALKDQYLLDANFYRKEFKSNVQTPGESTLNFFKRSDVALCRWLESEYLEIDKNNEEVRKVLDFMIRDQYMGKIFQCKEKIIFLRERFPLTTLKELADAADIYDKLHGVSTLNKTDKFARYKHTDTQMNVKQNSTHNTNGVRQDSWRSQNNTSQNTYRNGTSDEKRKCTYCSRTNHSDKSFSFYKPVSIPNGNNHNRNTRGQNTRMPNGNYGFSDQRIGRDNNNVQRNENVRWVYENKVENQGRNYYMEPNSMTGGDGITFNRHTIEENEHA